MKLKLSIYSNVIVPQFNSTQNTESNVYFTTQNTESNVYFPDLGSTQNMNSIQSNLTNMTDYVQQLRSW